jgi:hypothetical protein
MRSWLLVVLAGLGVAASLLLPVRPPTGEPLGSGPPPESVRYQELHEQVKLQREIVERVVWVDSLTRVLRAAATNGEPATVLRLSTHLPKGAEQQYEVAFKAQVKELFPDRAPVDVGLFYHRVQATPSDLRWETPHRVEYLIGDAGGRSYCIRNRVSNTTANAAGWMGICSLVLRYGRPGAEVFRWLKAGSVIRSIHNREDVLRAPASNADPDAEDRSLFTLRPSSWTFTLPISRCLAGQMEACEAHFLRPADDAIAAPIARGLSDAIPQLLITGPNMYVAPGEAAEEGLIAQLEIEFGDERFARFWTSELDVPAAFQEAFGVSAGEWMRAWVVERHPHALSSERAGIGYGIQTIVLIFAALGVGVLRERKRRLA